MLSCPAIEADQRNNCFRPHRHIAKYLPHHHPKFLRGNDRMKFLALCIFVLSLVPLSSAVADLSGQSGADVLSSIESGSGLWNWGSAPLGHVVDDSQLLSGVRKNPGDISIMETPLQAQGSNSGGLITPITSDLSDGQTPTILAPGSLKANGQIMSDFSDGQTLAQAANNGWRETSFEGFDEMLPLDKTVFKSETGVFDCSCFKALTVAQFPRVY